MNYSNLTPQMINQGIVNVKDLCYGTVGVDILLMVIFLIGLNFLSFFFWRKIDDVSFRIGDKVIPLLYLLPVINAMMLVIIGVMTYNLF